MIYKMSDSLYEKVTDYLSPDGLGVHVNSELDLEDFAKIILKKYGLQDLNKTDFPMSDFDIEFYHYQVVNQKLFNYFLLKWL